jgi:hypothetical protein
VSFCRNDRVPAAHEQVYEDCRNGPTGATWTKNKSRCVVFRALHQLWPISWLSATLRKPNWCKVNKNKPRCVVLKALWQLWPVSWPWAIVRKPNWCNVDKSRPNVQFSEHYSNKELCYVLFLKSLCMYDTVLRKRSYQWSVCWTTFDGSNV